MAYSKFHEAWEDLPSVDTPISAAALDHLEQGIADAAYAADVAGAGDASLGDWVDLGDLGATQTIVGEDNISVRNLGVLDQACAITITLANDQQIDLALEQGVAGGFAATFVGVDSWTTSDGDPPDLTIRTTGDVDFIYLEQIEGVVYGHWANEPAGTGSVDTSGTPVANDIARFTDANTIEGRSYAELKADLDLEIGTDVQAYDGDLAALAALSPSNDDIVQRKAGAWTNRTIAQLLTDLGIAAAYQPLDADLTDIAAIADAQGDIIVRGAAGWERLAKSATSTDVLTAGASQPSWTAPATPAIGTTATISGQTYGVTGEVSTDTRMSALRRIWGSIVYLPAGAYSNIQATTSVAGTCTGRFGVYAPAASGYPYGQAPLHDLGTIDFSASFGTLTLTQSFTIATSGFYWLICYVTAYTSTPTLRIVSNAQEEDYTVFLPGLTAVPYTTLANGSTNTAFYGLMPGSPSLSVMPTLSSSTSDLLPNTSTPKFQVTAT